MLDYTDVLWYGFGSQTGDPSLVQLLIVFGADVNGGLNDKGGSPRHRAATTKIENRLWLCTAHVDIFKRQLVLADADAEICAFQSDTVRTADRHYHRCIGIGSKILCFLLSLNYPRRRRSIRPRGYCDHFVTICVGVVGRQSQWSDKFRLCVTLSRRVYWELHLGTKNYWTVI